MASQKIPKTGNAPQEPRKRRASNRETPSVSTRDVAQLAGVSTASVSRCINNSNKLSVETRERIMAAIKKLSYTPNPLARDFRRGRTNMLLVVLPSIGDPFFTDVMRGVHEEARKRGYGVIISDTQLNSLTANEVETMLISRQADGIILFGTASPFGNEILGTRSRRAIPIVIGCEAITPELAQYASVHIDNIQAAREATNHLIGLGHRNIAFIAGVPGSLLTADREKGFRLAVDAAGVRMDQPVVVDGGLNIEGAGQAARRLLAMKSRPTAIFCANDETAIGAAHAIIESGFRIPEDMSLVGFDDTRYAGVMRPALTTIRQPAEEIGVRSVQSICREIENPRKKAPIPVPEIVPHQLIVRESTGPAPTAKSPR